MIHCCTLETVYWYGEMNSRLSYICLSISVIAIVSLPLVGAVIDKINTGLYGSGGEEMNSEWMETDPFREDQRVTQTKGSEFTTEKHIRVGIIMPSSMSTVRKGKVSVANTIGAVSLALERIAKERLLPGANFTFLWRFDDCKDAKIVAHLVEMIKRENVTVLIEPPCFRGALVSSIILKRYNVSRLGWTAMGSELSNKSRFAGRASTFGSPVRMSLAVRNILLHYNWRRIAMFYGGDTISGHCLSVAEHLHRMLPSADIINAHNIAVEGPQIRDSEMEKFLDVFSRTARIAVVCFENDSDVARLMTLASERGMTSNDYVYIILDYLRDTSSPIIRGRRYGAKMENEKLFQKAVFVEMSMPSTETTAYFKREIIRRRKEWPFFYDSLHPDDQQASPYSPFLHDTFYLYALALNETLRRGGSVKDDVSVMSRSRNVKFNGWTGRVEMDERGERKTKFIVTAYGKDAHSVPLAEIDVDNLEKMSIDVLVSDEFMYNARGGVLPRDTPTCGFMNEKCNSSLNNPVYWTIGGSIVGGVVFLVLLLALLIIVQRRIITLQTAKMNWRIDYRDIDWFNNSKRRPGLVWTTTIEVKTDRRGSDAEKEALAVEKNTARYGSIIVWTKRHEISAPFNRRSDHLHLHTMREMKHENINAFIGLCVEGTSPMSLWGYAMKGSLEDVIENETMRLDSFFKYLLIRDLSSGMEFLHSSELKTHGRLRSSNCVIDARWVLKVTDYGLHKIRSAKTSARDKLWTSPELLRLPIPPIAGTPKGDVYSFAIIVQEIVTCNKPYCQDRLSEEEIIFHVRNSEVPPFRPTIKGDAKENDIDDGVLQLMKECWNENPQLRPDFRAVKSAVRQFSRGRSTNLMDHVLKTMEKYAGSLEEVVADRMRQLAEESRKTDQLLCRLLPRTVAEKLKAGQNVEGECFECATILFSDVVGFTQIAARSTPIEIVNLLNELYTLFDDIIAVYDVYKVVTIGDGYMCASGLPTRNGNRHASEMADMALHVVSSMKTFRIPHLPNEKLEVRIGIHTGPVVAGIVGLTMPRYCVFGDTVNTAGRLEGSGKGSAIHMSDVTNNYLTEIIGGYITKPRGEVIIKGKGVIFTYWLLGKTGHSKVMISYPNEGTTAKEIFSGKDAVGLIPVESIE